MGCVLRIRLNHLAFIWYTVLSVVVQLYLLYLGLHRYRLYTEMKWPNGSYPYEWLTVYVTVLTTCIPLLVLFAAFGIFKSGNLAGDNEQISSRSERIIELTPQRRVGTRPRCIYCICHWLRSCWMHAPPLPSTIHIILAICQLFAQQIMLAQLYRFGFINSGDFLNTELDFAYHRSRQLVTNLPMGDTRLQGFRITSDELAESPMAPNLLPILMHARLFGIPLEFVNLVVALISYSCAYPSTFWRLSKAFSLCFSLHLLIHMMAVIYTYLSFSILYRVQETNYFSIRPVGIGQYLWSLRPRIVYHPFGIITTFIVTIVLMHISTAVFYSYGYNKYIINLIKYRRLKSARSALAHPHDDSISRRNLRLKSKDNLANGMSCDGYGPNIFAIIVLLLIVAAKLPTLHALTRLYQQEEKPLILSCIVVDVIYLFGWIIMWIALTMKREWHFRVIHNVREILSLQDALHTADGNSQTRGITELKNALIVMHRDHLFVTDDPIAKPSIMRQVVKHCGDEDTYWMRSNQSPASRRIPIENCNDGRGERTPEMSRLIERNPMVTRQEQESVPLAAAPYHYHMTSLPPNPGNGQAMRPIMGSSLTASANFGTIKRTNGTQYSSFQSGRNVEYGTLYGGIKPQAAQQQHLMYQTNYQTYKPNGDYSYVADGSTCTLRQAQPQQSNLLSNNIQLPVSNMSTLTRVGPTNKVAGVYGNATNASASYTEYNNNTIDVKDHENASVVSVGTTLSAGGGLRKNPRRRFSQTNSNFGTLKRNTLDNDRRPTFHSVDLKNRNAQKSQINDNYNNSNGKFVSFNEDGIKTYGETDKKNLNVTNGLTFNKEENCQTTSKMPPSPSYASGESASGGGGISRDSSSAISADTNTTEMAPPSIHGEPKITHNEESGSVFMECVVSNADSTKTKWFFNDKEIGETETYKFRSAEEGGNRKKYTGEIRKYNKSLQGTYKAVFTSTDEKENFCTFTVQSGNAPEFYDKPKIVQKDGGNIISIKVRAKSHLELSAEWFKDDKPIKSSDRIKILTKPDDKEKDGIQFLLEISGPQKEDQAKYKCVVKNVEGQNQQSLNLVFD